MTANNVISFAVFTEARALSLGMSQEQATNAALIADAAESKLSEMHNAEKPATETYEEKRAAREAKNAAADARLVEENPHLAPTEKNCLTDGAKNLRKELKVAFKGVKFSVRTERFSMGDAIRVSWTDGPQQEAVDAIVSKYQQSEYNAQEDYHGIKSDRFTNVFGGASYATCSRNLSDEYKLALIKAAGLQDPEEAVDFYNRGSAHRGCERGEAIIAAIRKG